MSRLRCAVALALPAMFSLACQNIMQAPEDAGGNINHPPIIVEGTSEPGTEVIDVVELSQQCTRPIIFRVGTVYDENLDQPIQERWVYNYDPQSATPDLGTLLTLTQDQGRPAYRYDPDQAYPFVPSRIDGMALNTPYTLDAFVSDGFVQTPAPGQIQQPTDVVDGGFLVRKSWVLIRQRACP